MRSSKLGRKGEELEFTLRFSNGIAECVSVIEKELSFINRTD